MDVNLMTQGDAYSALKEQGEAYGFLNANGQEQEPESYETMSYASNKPRRVKSTSISQQRQKVAAQRKKIAKTGTLVKKPARKMLPTKKAAIPPSSKKGLSLGAKIGIGVGVAALLGVGIYFIIKKKK